MANGVDFESVLLRMLQEDAGLSALVGSKVFPLFIPSGNYLPCVTFQRLGGRPANTLSGASGLEEIDLQIDVWARDYDEAKAIAKAVRAAMPSSGPRFSAHDRGSGFVRGRDELLPREHGVQGLVPRNRIGD